MNAKPFFVVITFVLLLALFAGGAMSNTDLTPDTPPATTDSGQMNFTSSFPANAGAAGDPLDSPCGSSYTVRSGDTLSRIAQGCNVTLADLLAANPSITNPNLINPGQKLYIYYAPLPTVPPAAAPTAVLPAAIPAAEDASIPTTGLRPGGSVHVSVSRLPGNTLAAISIGRVGDPPITLEERSTDEHGQITLNVAIPRSAKPGEQWIVTITTTTVPPVTVTSPAFVIE